MRALFALLLISGLTLLAQTPTATLTGTVLDSTGAMVPGATVTVRHEGTQIDRRVVADATGAFVITNLAPGVYEVMVEHTGFRRLHEKGLELQVAQVARIEPRLEVGQVVETMEVTATAPLLNTENQVKGEVITNQELVEMPLLSRDFTSLAYLVPGVTRGAEAGVGSFAVSGSRPENTNFLVDGFAAQDQRNSGALVTPPLEAMQEFKMQTSNFSAEFGRLSGGVMNMALKSGSNQFHGAFFEFFRNDAMDARNFFDDSKSKLRRNQFGVNLSGPVTIPGLYKGRDRTFFVVSWDALRQTSGAPRLGRVPEALEHAGDFSDSRDTAGKVIVVKDPYSNLNYAGNKVPASQFHAAGKAMMAYFPIANRPGQSNNYFSNKNSTGNSDTVLAKVDQKLFANDTLAVRFLKSLAPGTNPYFGSNLGVFGTYSQVNRTLAGLTYTRLFRPTLVNEFRFGVTRFARFEQNNDAGHDYSKELGVPQPSDPSAWGFPRIAITNLLALGDQPNPPVLITVNTYDVANTLTWIKGRHVLKFGLSRQRMQNFQAATNNNVRGGYNFLGRWSNHPIADFLLGLLDSTTLQQGRVNGYMLSTSFGGFVQDDFKVTPHLTLNLGLRYEMYRPPYEKYGRVGSFIPELGKLIVASDKNIPNFTSRVTQSGLTDRIGLASAYGVPESLVDNQNHNIGPRVGFAWRPLGGTGTVLRGGYGIFFGDSMNEAFRSDMTTNFPLTVNTSFARVTTNVNALTLSDPFPTSRTALTGTTNMYGMEWHAKPQNMQNWNLTVERALGGATVLEVAYVGTKGTHLSRRYDANQPYRELKYRLANGTFPRPFTGLGTVLYYAFNANSIYNAMQASLRRTFRNGFFYRVGYVYGKAIDDNSQVWANSKGGYPGVQDARNFRLERGRSDNDTGHALTLALSYEVPNRYHRLVRGWQLSSTGRMYTGMPFTVRVSNVNLDLGEANRPDRIAQGRLETRTADRWFDLNAFVPVPLSAFRMGNSGRNILDGPGMIDVSLSLAKRFRISEKHSVQFRLEAFNAINRTNLMLPENIINSPNVATIIQANPARVLQLGLRYQF